MCKCNENVSSEQSLEQHQENLTPTQLHDSISSESPISTNTNEIELLEEGTTADTEGTIEQVEAFDSSYALNEGISTEAFQLSPELLSLPTAASLEFGTAATESVCGRDGRVKITKTTQYPWRAICQLIITRADGLKARCTGWFIGPRTVMTSGHCLYSHTAGGWAKKIEVIPGMNGTARPYGSQTSSNFRSVVGWVNSKNSDFDYGCIILPNKTLGNRVGWFGFANFSAGTLQNMVVNNSGYAGDKPFGTQWFNAGRITTVTSRKLEYMIDTYGGHSGSPIWYYKNNKRYAVGIHGYGGCPNKAVRIIKPVFQNMLNWKNI